MADNREKNVPASTFVETDIARCLLKFQSAKSIWHIHYIMDLICAYLSYNDLKSLRIVNKICLETSLNTFVKQTIINAAESLPEFNENYDLSHLKYVTAIQFKGNTKVSAFEATFGKWLCLNQVELYGTMFLNDNEEKIEKYEVPANLMIHVETLCVRFTYSSIVIRTSGIPAVKKLETLNSVVFLDGPIRLIELKMIQSGFIKTGTVLSPSQLRLQEELDFSGLKRLHIKSYETFTLSVENLLELEFLQVQAWMGSGSRVFGWHDNLKIDTIHFTGLDVNLLEISPSVKICHFKVCTFNSCTPTNLKSVEIRSEHRHSQHESAYTQFEDSKMMSQVDLSCCTQLRTLCTDGLQLNTAFLPPSLQYLRVFTDSEIVGEEYRVDTLSIYSNHTYEEWHNEKIDDILQNFQYQTIHIDFEPARSYVQRYIESTEFENLIKELYDQSITMYLSGVEYNHPNHYKKSGFSKLVDKMARRYKFKNGQGKAISSVKFSEKVKHWDGFPLDRTCSCEYVSIDELIQ